MKRIYANGCSWTAGNGIEQDPLFQVTGNRSFYQVIADLGNSIYEHAWPTRLGKILGVESIVNDALGGSIYRRAS